MRLDTVTIRFEADTSVIHNALDGVLDHIDEVNEAMGVYASGVLDDTDDTGPAIGDIVSLASGGPDMSIIGVCPHGCVEVAWYDDYGMNIEVFPVGALVVDDGE